MKEPRSSPDPLRRYLRNHSDYAPELRRLVGDGPGCHALADIFDDTLALGERLLPTNADYHCCHAYLCRDEQPSAWASVFCAWWFGTFCTKGPENRLGNNDLIHNFGLANIVAPLVAGCVRLGRPAAHAAIPFVLVLGKRCVEEWDGPRGQLLLAARAALEAIEKLDKGAARAGRVEKFLDLAGRLRYKA